MTWNSNHWRRSKIQAFCALNRCVASLLKCINNGLVFLGVAVPWGLGLEENASVHLCLLIPHLPPFFTSRWAPHPQMCSLSPPTWGFQSLVQSGKNEEHPGMSQWRRVCGCAGGGAGEGQAYKALLLRSAGGSVSLYCGILHNALHTSSQLHDAN